MQNYIISCLLILFSSRLCASCFQPSGTVSDNDSSRGNPEESTPCDPVDYENAHTPVPPTSCESSLDSSLWSAVKSQTDPASIGSHQVSSIASTAGAGESNPRDIVARIYREELLKLAELAQASGNMAEYAMYERELERLSQRTALIASEVTSDVFGSAAAPGRLKDGKSAHRAAHKKVGKANVSTTKATSDDLDVQQLKDSDCPEDLSTGRASRDSLAHRASSIVAEMRSGATDFSMPRGDHYDCLRTGPMLRSPSNCDRVSASTTPMQMTLCGGSDLSLDSVKVEMQEIESEDSKSGSIVGADGDRSPLDLMQNIADSVVNKAQKKSAGSTGSLESTRHSLPPITSEQLKRCANLNTEDIVVAVRSTLADYSISQRLFGEAVLGLSQVGFGSVHFRFFLLFRGRTSNCCWKYVVFGLPRLTCEFCYVFIRKIVITV